MADPLEKTQKQECDKNVNEEKIEEEFRLELFTQGTVGSEEKKEVTVSGHTTKKNDDSFENKIVHDMAKISLCDPTTKLMDVTDSEKTEIQDAVSDVVDEKFECIVKGPAAQVIGTHKAVFYLSKYESNA